MSCCLAALLPHFLKNTHAHTRKHTHTDFFAQPFFCSLCAYASHESDSQTNKDLCHLIAHMSSKVCSQGDVPNQSKAEHTHTHTYAHTYAHTHGSQKTAPLMTAHHSAICCPSRSSFLTGRRPDTTKVWDLDTYWRQAGGNFTTLPEVFKLQGYWTVGMGKGTNRALCSHVLHC